MDKINIKKIKINRLIQVFLEQDIRGSDWDILNLILDKIDTLGYTTKTMTAPTISHKWISHNMSIIKSSWKGETICTETSDYTNDESKLSTYYRCVLKFIEWYNDNK